MKILVFLFTFLASFAHAADGNEKYTPTQLEWLVVELNARNPLPPLNATGVHLQYVAIPPDQINILVFGQSKAGASVKKSIQSLIESQKNLARTTAEAHGWKWLTTSITQMD